MTRMREGRLRTSNSVNAALAHACSTPDSVRHKCIHELMIQLGQVLVLMKKKLTQTFTVDLPGNYFIICCINKGVTFRSRSGMYTIL